MSASQDIYGHILAGCSITAGVDIAGSQMVKISGIGLRQKSEDIVIPRNELAELREAVVSAVLAQVAKGHKISFYIDYYGRQWIEFRTGVLIQKKQRLYLPSDVIDQIKSEVRAIRRPKPRSAAQQERSAGARA